MHHFARAGRIEKGSRIDENYRLVNPSSSDAIHMPRGCLKFRIACRVFGNFFAAVLF